MEHKIKIWILHAGLKHPSPYFYNFCLELDKYSDFEYIVSPDLPFKEKVDFGIIYFNRLKRFYKSDDLNSAYKFLKDIDTLKKNNWKIVWTIHNFFPIDRTVTDIDYYVTSKFIEKCDKVFTVSEYMKNSIKENYKVDAINHGVGINQLDNNNSINVKKSKLFTYTFIGNIYKYKMLDKVIESFNKLDNCRLIIAGSESKNAGVNIESLIDDNKNILFINSFIDKNDWVKLSKITDVFISVYDLKLPAFKYGFFPSNFINIANTDIKCISPYSVIFKEMMYDDNMIYYDFEDENGLVNAMKKAKELSSTKTNIKKKYDYSFEYAVKIFTDNCRKLF